MPIVPTLRLCLLAIVPALLGALAAFRPSLIGPMLAADGAVALLAAIDALLARGALVAVEREAPRVLSIGRANPVRLHLRSLARRPLAVSVTDDRPDGAGADDLPGRAALPPLGRDTVVYHLRPTRRGLAELGDHHVRYPSPLGLWQRQLRLPARTAIKVYPDVTAVRAFDLLARQSRESPMLRATRQRGGESEFDHLREYGPDDEFRHIDWKATARRGGFIVREMQQERNQTVVCALDCGRLMTAESDGLAQLDHALNAALMTAHVAARAGDHVGLFAFDAEPRVFLPPVGGRRAVHRVVQAAYDLHPQLVETDFDVARGHLLRRLRKRALVILFTQVIDDVSARDLLALVRNLPPRHLPLCVLFRDVDLDRMAEPPAGLGAAPPADLHIAAAAAEAISWRDRLVRDLKAAGALTLHVAPRDLTPAVVNRYLRIKAQHLL